MRSVKSYKAWFITDYSIEQVGELLVSKGLMASFEDDREDTYEWLEGDGADNGVSFNIWRKLGDDEYWDREPVSVYCEYEDTEPGDELLEDIATQITQGLGCQVWLGTIKNVYGDEYAYEEVDSISPSPLS
jgi:hypothetical protein